MSHFAAEVLAEPTNESTIWGNDADPDLDGLSNYLEFALGGDPELADAASVLPVLSRSGNQLKLSYTKQSNDAQFRVLGNVDLSAGTWSATGITQSPDPDYSHEGTLIEAVTELDSTRKFLKLEVLPID